ncbi:TIGR02594 family protein [Aeromonas schubertii]|uniref:TIGR02594 family protein n=1 Tax=Aeromonas schubertii TaxID=652 RepID=UPI0009E20C2D|nr:TIGR02594 family protein [Aeromonas schubertii]
MSLWITCHYDGKTKTAQYQNAQGECLLRQGGTLPWRTNNPGNLRPKMVNGKPSPKKVKTHIGFAKTKSNGYFLIFPTYEIGFSELKANLRRMHGDKTVEIGIKSYAPAHENNTSKYISDLERLSGVSGDRIINSLNESELNNVALAIEKIEGYHNEQETRKEIKTKLSQITLSDGVKPISGQVVKLKSNGKEKKLITDSYGRLPVIPHHIFSNAIELYISDIKNGAEKKLISIDPVGPAKNILSIFSGVIAKAKTRPVEPPQGQIFPERKKFQYTIRSGDSLWALAAKFKTSVSVISETNGIKDPARIYPGQKIWILPEAETGAEVRKAPSALPKTHKTNAITQINTDGSQKKSKLVATVNVESTRDSKGKPIATIPVMTEEAPWMQIALSEAKKWAGKDESIITKDTNYHVLTGHKWLKSLVGTENAWCASFVNYCLQQVGYPKSKNSFRARSFIEDGVNFKKVDTPVYGCIASNGSHATFVYGVNDKGAIIGLGGNQGNTIKFSPFNKMKYFIPVAYSKMYDKSKTVRLKKYSVDDLNKNLSINRATVKNEGTR